jgi:radical SAM superfamily enzyme
MFFHMAFTSPKINSKNQQGVEEALTSALREKKKKAHRAPTEGRFSCPQRMGSTGRRAC